MTRAYSLSFSPHRVAPSECEDIFYHVNCFVGFCTLLFCYAQKSMPDNPLLHIQFPVPFDQIQAAHVEPAVQQLLVDARARLETLGNMAAAPLTFDATLIQLDALTEPLDYAMGVVRHLEAVATYPELRAAYNAAQPEVSAFYAGIPLHTGLWNTLKQYAATAEA